MSSASRLRSMIGGWIEARRRPDRHATGVLQNRDSVQLIDCAIAVNVTEFG